MNFSYHHTDTNGYLAEIPKRKAFGLISLREDQAPFFKTKRGDTMRVTYRWLSVFWILCTLNVGDVLADNNPETSKAESAKFCEKNREEWRQEKEKSLQRLHDALSLNASQEEAWKQWVINFQSKDKSWGDSEKDHEQWASLSAIERLEKKLLKTQEHEQKIRTQIAATKSFYELLTQEQKKTFDTQFKEMKRWKWGGKGDK
jgi:hypothetical protein